VRGLIGLSIIVLDIGAGVTVWLKSPHHPAEAIAIAQEFVARLQVHDFARAYELTAKKQLVGMSLTEFEQNAQREFCTVTRVAGMAPFQSNGNRLRRRVYRLEVEMPELDGAIGLRFSSHPPAQGPRQWEIYNFSKPRRLNVATPLKAVDRPSRPRRAIRCRTPAWMAGSWLRRAVWHL
jgi:hypothetical protein